MRTWIAAALVMALVAGACADAAAPGDQETASGDRIDHPTGSRDVVLRLAFEGGYVPADHAFTSPPSFVLYGDGTVVTPGVQIMIYPAPSLPAIIVREVGEDGVQALLRRALEAGLGERDLGVEDVGRPSVTDLPTAVFTLSAKGRTTVARVYALDVDDAPGLTDAQRELRRRLARLAAHLTDLSWLPQGSVGDERLYLGEAARLLVAPYRPDPQLPQRPVDWPLAIDLGGAGREVGGASRCLVVEGEDWARLREVAGSTNQLTPWVHDGKRYSIEIRPLLPDESGC